MGWEAITGKVASAASKVAKSAIANAKYCTSVLNDFGFVQKALFQVYRREGKSPSTGIKSNGRSANLKFEYKEQFPVQINPTDINFDYGKGSLKNDKSRVEVLQSLGGIDLISTDYNAGTVSIPLTYNIYDEYNARTANGAVTVADSISLHSSTHTSLAKLRAYAGLPDYFVLFRWGEIHIFGFLESLSVTYSVYSCWGEPLVGTATATIARQPLEFDSDGIEKDPCSCTQLKITTGTAEAEKFNAANKALGHIYQGINAMR